MTASPTTHHDQRRAAAEARATWKPKPAYPCETCGRGLGVWFAGRGWCCRCDARELTRAIRRAGRGERTR